MPPLTAASAAVRTAVVLVAGAALGGIVRLCADRPSPPEAAAAAMTVVLAASIVAAACAAPPGPGLGAGAASIARAALLAWIASAAAGIAAGGGAGALGGAIVSAGAAVLTLGVVALLRRAGAAPGPTAFAGAAVACAPAAFLLVADPWIDWRGGTPESPERAQIALTANPLAAMTSPRGGLGVDFQRMPWLYDGPAAGVPGLSLIGQYYPGTPASPYAWGGTAFAAGVALAGAALLGRKIGGASAPLPAAGTPDERGPK